MDSVKVLSRPYPVAVAGTNIKFTFKTDTSILDMEFDADSSMDSPSLIYLPKHLYDGRQEVLSSDDLEYEFSSSNDQILEVRSRGREGKSWMVIGLQGQVSTSRSRQSWGQYLLSFLPRANLVKLWKR